MTAKKMTARKEKAESRDRKTLRLAETTDVSPNQAKDLMRKHGKDSAEVEKKPGTSRRKAGIYRPKCAAVLGTCSQKPNEHRLNHFIRDPS